MLSNTNSIVHNEFKGQELTVDELDTVTGGADSLVKAFLRGYFKGIAEEGGFVLLSPACL